MTKPAAKTQSYRLFVAIITVALFLPAGSAVLALEVDYPEIGGIELNTVTQNIFPVYLKYIFNFSLATAGMLALGVLFYAGFRYLTAGGSVSIMQETKQRIGSALLGLLILFGSYLILTTINPQLTFFEFPELIKLAPPPKVPEFAIGGDKILNYTELPIAGIAAKALEEERMEGIKKTMAEVQKKSKDLKKKSEELPGPVKSSTCSLLSVKGCTSFQDCGGGACEGDPCPQRPEIERIRAELFSLLDEQPEKIRYLLELIYSEINGLEDEKNPVLGLKKLLGDLESAEKKTKQCIANPVNAQSQRQKLLNDDNFWQYYESLIKQKKITSAEGEFPFPYMPKSQNPYDSATFYCAEDTNSIPLPTLKYDEEALKTASSKATPLKGKATSCGNELRLGQAIDDAELLLEEIIKKLEELASEISKEINSVRLFLTITEPDDVCEPWSCAPNPLCSVVEMDCPEPDDSGGEEPPPEEEEKPSSWLKSFFGLSKNNWVFAGDCDFCSAAGSCKNPNFLHLDDEHKAQIFNNEGVKDLIKEISDSDKKIEDLAKDLVDLIDEKLKDKIKISEIFKKIEASNLAMGSCFNTREEQIRIDQGKKETRRIINSCSFIKKFDQSETKCYGPDPNNLLEDKKFDNFFCCETETGL